MCVHRQANASKHLQKVAPPRLVDVAEGRGALEPKRTYIRGECAKVWSCRAWNVRMGVRDT